MQILLASVKGVLSDKKKSLGVVCAVALATVLTLLTISISMSFALKTVDELRTFSPILILYTQLSNNALNSWVGVANVLALVFASLLVLGTFVFRTTDMKKEFKNYALMGASFMQIAGMTLIKNTILTLVGVIAGTIISLLASLIIGAIFSIPMVFAISNVFICLIIYLALEIIISIVIPLWS